MRWSFVVLTLALVLPSCGGGSPAEPTQATAAITVSPSGTGIVANATEVGLSASGTGAQPLRYSWTLGDGTDATGPQVSHVYEDEGSYTATLTVTDGEGRTATASVTILARRLDGTWRMRQFGWRYELRQLGTVLSGRVIGQDEVEYSGVVPLVGQIEQPNTVSFTAPNFSPVGFTGTPDLALDTLTGTAEFAVPRSENLDRTSVLPPIAGTPPAPTPIPTPAPPFSNANEVRVDTLIPPVGSTLREGDFFSIGYTYRKSDASYFEGLALIRDDGREFMTAAAGGEALEAEGGMSVTLIPANGVLGFARGHTIDALWVVGTRPLFDERFEIVRSNVVYSQPIELDYRVE